MRILTTALLVAGLCACTSSSKSVNTIERADPGAAPRQEWIDKVVVRDSLEEQVHVESAYIDRGESLIRLQLNVVNDDGDPLNFRYRFEWFDEKGMKLYNPSEAWVNETVLPGQRLSLQATTADPRAVDWRFTVQESKL